MQISSIGYIFHRKDQQCLKTRNTFRYAQGDKNVFLCDNNQSISSQQIHEIIESALRENIKIIVVEDDVKYIMCECLTCDFFSKKSIIVNHLLSKNIMDEYAERFRLKGVCDNDEMIKVYDEIYNIHSKFYIIATFVRMCVNG